MWDLISEQFTKIESCYNKSIKIMADLPYATHRYLIEHITQTDHIRKIIIRRYLKFIQSLTKSKKPKIKCLLDVSTRSSKSITGRKIHRISLETGILEGDLSLDYASLIEYFPTDDKDI